MPSTMRLIARTILGSNQATVTFSSIPQTYTDLYVVLSGRTDSTGGGGDDVNTTFNGSTSGYSNRRMFGSGSTASSDSNHGGTASLHLGAVTDNGSTANTFGTCEIYISNYAGSTNKSVSATGCQETNAAAAYLIASAGLWSNTAPVTSIAMSPGHGTVWLSGSTFFLYGITSAAGSVPGTFGVDATGGDVTISGGYKYHVFRSSGQLTVAQPGWAEVLVVGGGGGGAEWGGGGGAGGFRLSSLLVQPGPTSVIVGAGAPTTNGYGVFPASASDSSLGTFAALGGGRAGPSNNGGGAGGSGGGASLFGGTGGAGTSGQGNAGGNTSTTGAGGGGGAGAAGGNAVGTTSGSGGAGSAAASVWGAATDTGVLSGGLRYFAGGGGGSGSAQDGYTRGLGGVGGGGDGQNGATAGTAGTANTGGGGGGGGRQSGITYAGGAGGSGIVIVRYPVT